MKCKYIFTFVVLGIIFFKTNGLQTESQLNRSAQAKSDIIYVTRGADSAQPLLHNAASAHSFGQPTHLKQQTPAARETTNSEPSCSCYCSDICLPRARRADDIPFIDPETGICFCKQRDKDNYISNGCHVKNPNPVIEDVCCQTLR